MINFPLQWHPRFLVQDLKQLGALFLAETDQFLLPIEEFHQIDHAIEQQAMLSDYVFATTDMSEQIGRLNRIDKLIAEKILHHPNETASYTQIDSRHFAPPGQQRVINLSSIPETHTGLTPILQAADKTPHTIIIVDDYLDPYIESLADHFYDTGQRWLLVKLNGEHPTLGPVFGDQDQACYHCLKTRLVMNQPVREWYRRYNNATHPVMLPQKIEQQSVTHAAQFFADLLQHTFESSRIYQLNPHEQHTLIKRPQCEKCGDPELFQTINHASVNLMTRQHHIDQDGGLRQNSREQTLEKITPAISPLCGIISHLSDITDSIHTEPDTAMPNSVQQTAPEATARHATTQPLRIFRAAYFQQSVVQKKITADTFVELSLGKGVSEAQARVSALGEAIERQAAQYQGDEGFVFSTQKALNEKSYSNRDLSPFSDRQYQHFAQRSGTSLEQPQWLKPSHKDTPLHWAKGWSLSTQSPVYFPAAHCFANTPFSDRHFALYTHNGNAAGNNQEEAILQGLFELVERDAAAIWWYNRIPRPQIALEVIAPDVLSKIQRTLDREWTYWLLDISHDLDITCCVAVGQHKNTGEIVLGFGAHLAVDIASQRALTEMFQLITIKDQVSGPFDFKQLLPQAYLLPRVNTAIKTRDDFSAQHSQDIRQTVLQAVERLSQHDLDTCIVNYTRPDLPLSTLKVIVPGLSHFWPQFANQRLYNVPQQLGWLSQPLNEDEFNPMPLYL